jgi:acyl-CoA oxidase
MFNRLLELQVIHGWDEHETFGLAVSAINETLPITLHKSGEPKTFAFVCRPYRASPAFQPVFMSQGGPTLIKKYGPLVSSLAIIGCYLQTELGHGSNVARLETTATYIPESREFELHSPTFTSSKWWIGGLSKTATHGVVQARLILPGGEDRGPHLFFVQLRSLGMSLCRFV